MIVRSLLSLEQARKDRKDRKEAQAPKEQPALLVRKAITAHKDRRER